MARKVIGQDFDLWKTNQQRNGEPSGFSLATRYVRLLAVYLIYTVHNF